ncbi:rhodanese-like domain-containing protein [Mumia sp. DW29H23]|uniref:rhodanese-like domain-containing protein n=1 Tax=Mumia sp. DW29H23 TaxID=3421241 RepID=UPI003D69C3E2
MSDSDPSSIDRLLAQCRRHIDRVQPEDLERELAAGALVVDIRPSEQRRSDGPLPGAVVIDRNVLEWRLDPTSPHRLAGHDDPDRRIVVVCNEGYGSSLAAYTLAQLGLTDVADLVDGFQGWAAGRAAGTENGPGSGESRAVRD